MGYSRRDRTLVTAIMIVGAIGFHSAASAQEAPPPAQTASPDPTSTVPATGAGVEDQNQGLGDIVVTAQRRSENLQRAAISVTAVSPEQLVNRSITAAADLTTAVPGLQASNNQGFTVFYIRGVGSAALNAYSEPAVAFNFDGVYISRPNAVNGQFFDIERVEVLKGPQGTLYGRNATGGAVNLITRKPDLGQFGGYVGAQFGNYNTILTTGALNVPIGDKGGLRFAFQTENRDGYFRDGTDDADSRAFRLSLRAEPIPSVAINIVADYSKLGGKGSGAALLPLGTSPVRGGLGDPAAQAFYSNAAANFFIFPGAVVPVPVDQARLNVKTGGVLGTVDIQTPLGTLTGVSAYREVRTNNLSTSPGFFVLDQTKQNQASFEARLASDTTHPLRYVLGAYYFTEDSDFLTAPDDAFVGVVVERGRTRTRTAAGFGQLTYAINDAFRLTGGARYTWERKGLAGTHGLAPPAVFTSGPNLNPLVIGTPQPQIVLDAERTFTAVTWKAGVEWDAGPRSLVYANVGTGFKAGGFFFAQDNNTYRPEKVTAYSLGTKNRFLDNRLQLNLEAFLLKYRDQQLAHIGFVNGLNGPTAGFPTENVGRSTNYGLDADIDFKAARTLRLGAQVSYTHSRYDRFLYRTPDFSGLTGQPAGSIPPPTGCRTQLQGGLYAVDCSGRQAFQTPTWTVSGSIEKTFELGKAGNIVAEVRSRFESPRFLSDSYVPLTYAGSNTRTDANLTYNPPGETWSISAYVTNIENKDVPGYAFNNPTYPIFPGVAATLRPPRTYGVRGRFSF